MRKQGLARAAALLLAAGSGAAAWPMMGAQPDSPGGQAADGGQRPAESGGRHAPIRFNFKGATFDQVIDFFSRATGLPVVREADVPQGTLDYLAPESYTLEEALRVLNIILHAKGVALRVSDDMLYLQKLTEMQRKDIPVFVGRLPAEVRPNDVITVVRPLEIALAKPLADKMASMVAEYGSVTAMEQQNSLVITETAAQVRRLLTIVEELDRQDPEGAVEIFPIRHAKAAELMGSLKALLSQRVEKYVINQKGEQVKIEEEQMPGLSITADERTNAIIAKGAERRMARLREAIDLLDVPDVGAGRAVRTFALQRLAPSAAAGRLTQLYAKLPEDERPTVLPLDEVGKLTLVGSTGLIEEARALLREIDGDGIEAVEPARAQRAISVVPLEHADPAAAAAAARNLLNGRQLVAVKMVPGPDGRSLLVAGLPADVEALEKVLSVLDRPAEADRSVRLLRLTGTDPQATVARSRELYGKQVDEDEPRWRLEIDYDADARLLTVIGGTAAQQRFAEVLRMVQEHAVVDRETRQMTLEHAEPREVVGPLAALARQLLEPRDGSEYVEPQLAPVDPLDLLVVTALPEQFGVLENLVATLDRPSPGDFQFRVVPLSGMDGQALMEKADFVYQRLTEGMDPQEHPAPAVQFDPLTGNLLVSGEAESVATWERAVAEARRLLPPSRTGRLIEVRNAGAADVIGPLRELLETAAPVDPARSVPEPTIELVERTNSLYVVAEPAQHQMIERFVSTLDRLEPTELPPMQLLQVRAADAEKLARMLRERYAERPAEQRREQPVEVDADSGTNTLIVTAHPEVFGEIRTFVDSINRAGEAERETMLFSLNRARAADLAQALDKLYPQPPMPRDRRGRPLPHLQKPKEVHVSADPATNTLIVEAPAERRAQFEALVEQLDRVQLPPQADLRTYHIERGDVREIAGTLQDLARQGVLSAMSADGRKPVEVTVMAEPVSKTLIVAGDAVTFEKTEAMLADLQAVPIRRSLRAFEVTGADPREVADRALRLYEEQTTDMPDATEVSVEVDRENSVLLVVADDEAMVRVASILDELQASIGPPPDVQLYPLEFEEATAAVGFLRDLAESALSMIGRRGGPPPVFAAIERTNSVLVGARRDQQQIIGSLLRGFDEPQEQAMPPLRILQLRAADAQNLARALQQQYDRRPADERQQRPVRISSDPQTNALIVAAHAELMPEIAAVVEELNEADLYGADGREIRIFPLRVARAEELARTIDEMFPPPPVPRDRRGRPLYHLQQPREIVVRADRQTNALIVDAPVKRMAGFEKLVEQLDRQEVLAEAEVRTYRILHADLNAVRSTLQQLASGGSLGAAARKRRVPVSINAEPVSRTLVVSGPAEIFERVETVLDELDAPRPGPETTLRFFRLANARAESLVPMLREILLRRLAEDVEDAGRDAAEFLNISADRKTNTLIVSAPPQIMPVADALVEELDHPRAAVHTVDVRIFHLTQAAAGQVADAVRRAVDARARAEGETTEVTIAPEPSSNSIVVTAPPRRFEEIESLIESLDGKPPADQHQVRTIFLEHARAERVAPIVEQMLAREEMLDVNRLPVWARFNFFRMQQQTGGPEATIRVAADESLNAVVVSAPPALLDVAEQMVAQLDVAPGDVAAAARRSVRILVVENADAAELARNLEGLFEEPGTDPAPVIRVDSASNSLLVRGTDEQFATIEQVVGRIDRATVTASRQMRMLPLDPAQAQAAEIARALQRMLGRRPGGVQVITLEQLLERRGATEKPGESGTETEDEEGPPTDAGAMLVPGSDTPGAQRHASRLRREAWHPRVGTSAAAATRGAQRHASRLRREAWHPRVGTSAAAATRGVQRHASRLRREAWHPGGGTSAAATRFGVQSHASRLRREAWHPRGGESAAARVPCFSRPSGRERHARCGDIAPRTPGHPAALPPRYAALLAAAFAAAGDDAEEGGAPSAFFSGVTIAVDEASNSLVVVGSPRAIERVAALTRQLVDQLPAAPGRIRYVPLPQELDAWSTSRLLIQALGQITPPGGRRGELRRRVAVIADRDNNALIIACNDADFETVGDLLAALSRPTPAEQTVVKVYPLEQVTAERAAESVRALIEPDDRRRRGRRQTQRMREVALRLLAGDRAIEAVFNPQSVRVSLDSQSNSLIVMGPPEAIGFVDRFVELLDQTPVNVQATLKLYPLQHARANEVRRTLHRIFRTRFYSRRRQLGPNAIVPDFSADERTNTLLVTAAPEQLAEVDALLDELDRKLGEDRHPLRMIELKAARAREAADILDQVVIGSDQSRRASTQIVPHDGTGMLLVRAGDEVMAEIDSVLAEIDRAPTSEFKVRTIVLERADASAVAQALQRLYDDRARIASAGRGRRRQMRRISIIGDANSNTLLVAASDEDFAAIEELVQRFDTPQASQALTFRVLQLTHAKATEIADTVQNLANQIQFAEEGPWWARRQRPGRSRRGTVAVEADARLNALVVTGEGDKFEVVEELVEVLDAPQPEGAERHVKLYRVKHADVDLVADVLRETYTDTNRRWWEPPDPTEVKVRTDPRHKLIIVYGSADQQAEIGELVAGIDGQIAPGEQEVAVIGVEFAQAHELARTLDRFLRDRAEATGGPPPTATIAASRSANTLVVSAEAEQLATVRDLVGHLDQPSVSADRSLEIVALREGDADEVARIVRQQFGRPRRGGAGVIVTADARTNSIIINAPRLQYAQARALIERLDAPSASDETIIRTYALQGARADEAVRILGETLQLDERGETRGITIRPEDGGAAVEVKARIVADRRSNSLIVTATEESFAIIESLVAKIDDVPASSPVEYRIIPLEHALAADVHFTLERFLRRRGRDEEPQPRLDYNRLENQLIVAATADQFEQIERIIRELDVPSDTQRITDFVPLRFAQAEQVQEALSVFYGPYAIEADSPGELNARIVADPATNSLVITADRGEWENIRTLLEKLDSEEYDASLQLRVIPLTYADAQSVARAVNDAFSTEVARGRRDDRRGRRTPRGEDERREPDAPTLLIEAEEWVRAAAEPMTNSVIVSASRQNIEKIEEIVARLDVADYAKLPPPKIIPLRSGSPEQIADSLRRLYAQDAGDRGRRALRIVGDAASNSVIVRAGPEEFLQIRALAETLQSEASQQGLGVHVLTLRSAPAARVAAAVREAYSAKAQRTGQPLAVHVDPRGNTLVIASTAAMFDEIRGTVDEIDRLAPAAGQGIFIIELEHVSPEAAKRVIETIGLDRPPRDDTASRLVTEPVRAVPLSGRNALIVVANPADRETIVGLLKAVDSEPELAEARVRVVQLRNADAQAVVELLRRMLDPADQQAGTALARAVQEQVRRLSVSDGGGEAGLRLDLTRPIRLIADANLNAVVVSSTAENVDALAEVITIFDRVPVTDAVTVQLFPLSNIAATQFARIVRDLFTQGKRLGTVPGTAVEGVPEGQVGRALLDEVAVSVDERTNTVIVAGKMDAVALVEVLHRRIDTDVGHGWIEPRIVPLRYADPEDLAETLNAVIVEGAREAAGAGPLQRQVARLRMARMKHNGGRVLEADVFAPMTRLVIRPEPDLEALVLVGTPMNLEVVTELIEMLDVEAAAPGALVRVYPLEHASASRLAATVTRLFDQQVQSGAIRSDDRVIVQADDRTNALVVSTSRQSFTILEGLLETLDASVAPDLQAVRRLELDNASATRLAPMVQQLMDARLERLRRLEPETAELERSMILPDARTNSLVVAAGAETFDVIRRVVEDLDGSYLGDDALVRVVTVATGSVERIAETVRAVMERRYADLPQELRRSQQPLVLTDPRSNSLLVAAGDDDLAAIRDLVEKLEAAPSNPAIRLAVIPLEGSQARSLAPRLQTLMRQRQQSLGREALPSDRVSIEPDTGSNSLIVAGSAANLEVVRNLIDALLRAGGDGKPIDVVQLVNSQAAEVVDLLEDLYVREANRRRGGETVQVTADERLNAVLVNAPPADVQRIKSLVAQLDGTKPTAVVDIKYIPLTSANALETVGLVENVLSGRGIGRARTSRQATVLRYLHEYAQQMGGGGEELTEMEVSAAVRESITLTPDLRTNTVIVSAPRRSMALIEQMIRDLDASSVGSQNVRIFKLKNADALAMAQILTDLFNLSRQGNLYVLKPREQQEREPAPPASGGAPSPAEGAATFASFLSADLTAVPDDRQELSITVDSRTNSLLVSGTPLYLDLVDEVVQTLDAVEANEREVFIYQCRNAVAAEVADVISSFVEQEQQKLISTLSPDQLGSASRLLEREITIVGDEKSNTVLVSASPRYVERVRQMIVELDVDPPQVLIQVLLAEVTLTSTLELGVDSAFEAGPYGGDNLLVGGMSNLTSFFLPSLGIPNLSVSTDDFSLLLRALESQGRLQVLSNPSVMAANNQPARIQVGETIRLPESTSFDLGSQQSSVVPEDIGIILEVTPSINPDGFVRMNVRPEISELSSETTQISEDFESPIITRRTAESTITVRDGQTIVMGGLISDRFERRERQVPLLGDIPLLGFFFRSETEDIEKVELLIVLTPHVITSPAEFDRVQEVTGGEIDRLSLSREQKRSLRRGMLERLKTLHEDDNPGEEDATGGEAEEAADAP